MSQAPQRLPGRPSLDQLRKQAKDLLRQYRAGDTTAAERFRSIGARAPQATNTAVRLADAQFVVAREYGFATWAALARHIEAVQPTHLARFEQLAYDLVAAYHDGHADALRRLDLVFPGEVTRERLRGFVDQRLSDLGRGGSGGAFSFDQARLMVARHFGFDDWGTLAEQIAQPPASPGSAPHGLSTTPPFYRIDRHQDRIDVGQLLSGDDWDDVFDAMAELRITRLNANGQMTDDALRRLAKRGGTTHLAFGGTKHITDGGLAYLADLPSLRAIDLSDHPGGQITDRGLEVLGRLPDLREIQLCWQSGVSDRGVAHLRACQKLERVDLMGTPTGDGAVEALAHKPTLHHLKTGRLVTDAGLRLFSRFPAFATWQGGEPKIHLMDFDAGPTFLLLDGPFTDDGLASLEGLDGLFGLSFFWHTPAFTSDGFAPLARLANLGFLGCDGKRCDDRAMRHIGSMPRLRMLMAQGTVAGHDGFEALSRSQSIEHLWGRQCPNLEGRGFSALARMPALRGLAVSCKRVDDNALGALPDFPSLRALMPMDVSDDGFRHVGRCERLENLWCMYCQDTGDVATQHIADLANLRTYYAGLTQITDVSLEILGQMRSLEKIELHRCSKITDTGMARLAQLPRLTEIAVEGSPSVTRAGLTVFPATIHVRYQP